MADELDEATANPLGDKQTRQRFIASRAFITLPATAGVLALFYFVIVPPPSHLDELAARFALTLRWLPVALLPYAAVCLTIAGQRFFEGSHNLLLGAESERLRIHARVMQNTLEQLIWFVIATLALATYLEPGQMQLVPIVCCFFAFARFVYWWGYLRQGTLGRAPGVQLTFALNVNLLLVVLVLLVRSLLSRGG